MSAEMRKSLILVFHPTKKPHVLRRGARIHQPPVSGERQDISTVERTRLLHIGETLEGRKRYRTLSFRSGLTSHMAEDQRKVYEQDCNFVRYHDGLMWSRMQTASAVETAMVYALYQIPALGPWERRTVAISGTMMVSDQRRKTRVLQAPGFLALVSLLLFAINVNLLLLVFTR
jgi:hypothetical protein